MPEYLHFQKKFVKRVCYGHEDTFALSIPRGNGKSWLGSELGEMAVTPGSPLYRKGEKTVLVAGSIRQCEIVYDQIRANLEEKGVDKQYRFISSATRVGVRHKETNTQLYALGSNPKTSLGLVRVPLLIFDEPGAQNERGGQALWDSVRTAQGKHKSRLKVVLIGTLAPAKDKNWWPELVRRGSTQDTYVQALMGRREKWKRWAEVMRVNPICKISESMVKKLRLEHEAARQDSRLEAAFLSYRMNIPTAEESEVLLTVQDWEATYAREIPAREEAPIVGVDLGGNRAWSAAAGIWENGCIDALAVAPGIPSLRAQEERDRVPAWTYQNLAQQGKLAVAEGLRVPKVSQLWNAIVKQWGVPEKIVCDRFRLAELEDVVEGACVVVPRITRWSESSEDIRALRKHTMDGPFVCAEDARDLVAASLAVAEVKNDDAGNVRLIKRGTHNEARDDVAAALVLAAGEWARGDEPGLYELYSDLVSEKLDMTVEAW